MGFVCLFQCQVGALPYLSQATPPGEVWMEADLAELQAVAQEMTPGNWEKLHQHAALTTRWLELTAAYGLPELEKQLAELESKLDDARRQRTRLGRGLRPERQPQSPPEHSRRVRFWDRVRPPSAEPRPEADTVAQAQRWLEAVAREHASVQRQVKTLTAQRWAQTFEQAPPRTLWFVLPLTAEDVARRLAARGLGQDWPRVPALVLSCPVGSIPEDTFGHPGEREPRRWYFRTGQLAQRLLGPHERPADREALIELEDWVTAMPARASTLAERLGGLSAFPGAADLAQSS